jgi:hypothetical protein
MVALQAHSRGAPHRAGLERSRTYKRILLSEGAKLASAVHSPTRAYDGAVQPDSRVRRNLALFKKRFVRDCGRFPFTARPTRSSISDQRRKSVVIEIAFISEFSILNPCPNLAAQPFSLIGTQVHMFFF